MNTILLLGAHDDPQYDNVWDYLAQRGEVLGVRGAWGDPLPEEVHAWSGSLLVSYRSRWIIPAEILSRASMALNFHPGPPEYPGVGGANWALYEGASQYGVTAHLMTAAVDAGPIVGVRRFALHSTDTVHTLLARTYPVLLSLFYATIQQWEWDDLTVMGEEVWGHARRRADLNALATLQMDMDEQEVRRRLRATTYRQWKPVLHWHGMSFEPVAHDPR